MVCATRSVIHSSSCSSNHLHTSEHGFNTRQVVGNNFWFILFPNKHQCTNLPYHRCWTSSLPSCESNMTSRGETTEIKFSWYDNSLFIMLHDLLNRTPENISQWHPRTTRIVTVLMLTSRHLEVTHEQLLKCVHTETRNKLGKTAYHKPIIHIDHFQWFHM